jgi:putative DNA primase/helicase
MNVIRPQRLSELTEGPITEEERVRRLGVEVERMAGLPPFEWQFYLEETASKHCLESAKLKQMIEATIRANEKKERESKADDRREKRQVEQKQEHNDRRARQEQERDDKLARQEQERDRKETERARKEDARIKQEQEARQKKRDAEFAEIAKLPKLTHEARLKEAAKRLDEDPEALLEEFQLYFAELTLPDDLTPWDEPVPTAELLTAIESKFRRYVVVSDAVAAATTVWTPFTYVIEIAVHVPKLVFTFPERDAGKSTALGVLRWMVQRPYLAVEATGAAVYRIVDRLKPTLLLDEADTLFDRSTVLAHIINESWSNGGAKIPRVGPRGEVVEFDPYSAQAIAMKGLNMHGTTLSRCIVCTIWPKLPSEMVEDFNARDDEEFKIIRRKLVRWSVDNAAALRSAAPESSFNNRTQKNWKILLAIADLAGGEWPKRVRDAALELETGRDEPSEDFRLFAATYNIISGRTQIRSLDLCKALAADPSSEWANYHGKGPISQTQVAARYRSYGIRPVTLHPTKRANLTCQGYREAQFDNVFARVLQKPTKDPHIHTLDSKGKTIRRQKGKVARQKGKTVRQQKNKVVSRKGKAVRRK